MIRIDNIHACKIELTEDGWKFYFFSRECDFEVTVLRDHSLRIRQEKPLVSEDK